MAASSPIAATTTRGVAVVARIPAAARLALPAQVIDADLARLEAVEERLEVGDADGEDAGARHHGGDDGELP